MSSGTNKEYVSGYPRKLGNIDFERVSTNQEGVALPVVQGTARLGVTWLDGAKNVNAYAVKVKVGKSKETVGYNYYADMAGVICLGPVDRLLAVYSAEETIWSGDLTDPGTGYVNIQTTVGNARFRFGTPNQTISGYVLDPAKHPGYQNQAIIEFKQMFFGRDTTNARQIEVLIVRAVPDADMIDDRSINAAAALREVVSNSLWGAGQNLPLSNVQTVQDQLAEDAIGMSFNLNSIDDAEKVVEAIIDTFNGDLVWEKTSGEYILKQGYRPPANTAILPVIMAAQCTSLPKTKIKAYVDQPGELRMNYINRARNFNDAQVLKRSQGHRLLNGIRKTTTLERQEIDNTATALKLLAQAMVQMSLPAAEGSFEIRAVDAETVNIADWFWLELWTGADLTMCRCTSKKQADAFSRDVAIEYEADSTRWAYTGAAGGAAYTPPDLPEYLPETHIFQQLIETPRFMSTGIDLITAVGRAHSPIVGFTPYFALDADPTYSTALKIENSAVNHFGLPVEVKNATGTATDLVVTPLNNDVTEYESVAAAAQQAGELLLFIGDEIISLRDLFINGNDLELDSTLRGFGDTKPKNHAAGAQGIIIYAAEAFRINPAPGETTNRNIKLPAETLLAVQDLDEVDPIPWVSELRINRPLNISALTIEGEVLPKPAHHYNLADYDLVSTPAWNASVSMTVAKQDWSSLGFISANFYTAADLYTRVRAYGADEVTLIGDTSSANATFSVPLASEGHATGHLEITTYHPDTPELESQVALRIDITFGTPGYAVDANGDFAIDGNGDYATE